MVGVDLLDVWPLPGARALGGELLAAYSAPDRHYHDARHLAEVLDRLDELAGNGARFEELPVRLAAWFHDGIYDAQPGAERRSADWAARALADLVPPATLAETVRLVLLTEHHRPATEDRNGAALSDADLAILAAGPERYADYTASVRAEYADLPEPDFAAGRAAILSDLLAKPTLFHTAHARTAWEPRARANVARELAQLTASGR